MVHRHLSTVCPQHYPPTDFQRRSQTVLTVLFNNFPISFFLRSFFSSQFFRSIFSFINFSTPINLHLFSFVHQNLSSDLIIREIKSNELYLFSFCSLLIYTCTFACNKLLKTQIEFGESIPGAQRKRSDWSPLILRKVSDTTCILKSYFFEFELMQLIV